MESSINHSSAELSNRSRHTKEIKQKRETEEEGRGEEATGFGKGTRENRA
jgi:hypothetical protein